MKIQPLFIAFSALLVFSNLALAKTNHNIGDPCTKEQLGTTEMAADQTGIIGCFRKGAGIDIWEWKSGSSSSIDYSTCLTRTWSVAGSGLCPTNYVFTGANYHSSDSAEWDSFICCLLR
ncbi:MAG: hypothetical protein PHD48_05260 [Alphaproteobacteria bacterium]|nr:hypothetical protein [Alphaproteobacteria bacterium]